MPEKMQVLMMPDFRPDNPYQTLLSEALLAHSVEVDFPKGYRRVLPLRRALQQSDQGYDLLHLHWTTPYLKGESFGVRLFYSVKFLIDICFVRLANVQVVWTIHNLISHEADFPRLELWFYRMLAWLANGVVVHHQQAKQDVAECYGVSSEKVQVIPHGHYRTAYGQKVERSLARKKIGLPTNVKLYLHFGMLRPYKGIESLLSVWKREWVQSDAMLLIVGKPMNDAYLDNLNEMTGSLGNVVLRSGYVDDADIPLYFSAADVVVLPFEKVLTSGSLLLAMSYDLPVIAPRIGSIPETLLGADDLLYCAKEGQAGLAKALRKSKDNLRGYEERVVSACDRLEWSHIGAKTHQTYQMAKKSYAALDKRSIAQT